MLDNLFNVTFQKLDAQSCNSLADYLEAQASVLRRRADNEEAQLNGRRDGLKNLHLAAIDALEFFDLGLNKVSACNKSATQNRLKFINVEAVFETLLKERKHFEQSETRKKAFYLRTKGKTVREIAKLVDLSPSRISQILKKS